MKTKQNLTNEKLELLPVNILKSKYFSPKCKLLIGELIFLNGMEQVKNNGYFFRTNKALIDAVGMSEPTLLTSLRKLEMINFFERKPGKRGEASEYRLNEDVIFSFEDGKNDTKKSKSSTKVLSDTKNLSNKKDLNLSKSSTKEIEVITKNLSDNTQNLSNKIDLNLSNNAIENLSNKLDEIVLKINSLENIITKILSNVENLSNNKNLSTDIEKDIEKEKEIDIELYNNINNKNKKENIDNNIINNISVLKKIEEVEMEENLSNKNNSVGVTNTPTENEIKEEITMDEKKEIIEKYNLKQTTGVFELIEDNNTSTDSSITHVATSSTDNEDELDNIIDDWFGDNQSSNDNKNAASSTEKKYYVPSTNQYLTIIEAVNRGLSAADLVDESTTPSTTVIEGKSSTFNEEPNKTIIEEEKTLEIASIEEIVKAKELPSDMFLEVEEEWEKLFEDNTSTNEIQENDSKAFPDTSSCSTNEILQSKEKMLEIAGKPGLCASYSEVRNVEINDSNGMTPESYAKNIINRHKCGEMTTEEYFREVNFLKDNISAQYLLAKEFYDTYEKEIVEKNNSIESSSAATCAAPSMAVIEAESSTISNEPSKTTNEEEKTLEIAGKSSLTPLEQKLIDNSHKLFKKIENCTSILELNNKAKSYCQWISKFKTACSKELFNKLVLECEKLCEKVEREINLYC